MIDHFTDNLSVIHESMEDSFHTVEEEEGLQEMLGFLGLFEEEYMGNDDVQEVIVEYGRVGKENSLTSKLKSIKQYAQRWEGREVGQFLLRKYKNLVRCVLFHQTTLLEDYSLLFDILLATCRQSGNHTHFLGQLQTVTAKLQSQEPYNLAHSYLQVIYLLIRIKLSQQGGLDQVARLKQCCIRSALKVISEFAIKIIVNKSVGEIRNFQFIRDIVGQTKYNRYVGHKKQEAIKEPKICNKNTTRKRINVFPQLPRQHEPTKSEIQTKDESIIDSYIKQGNISTSITPLPPSGNFEENLELLEGKQKVSKQVYDSIKSVSIKDIKQMVDGRHILGRLLHLSFEHCALMADSIEKALYFFQIQEFIDQMRHLFQANRECKEIQTVKKIVKKQLKNYCGKDANYYWGKIYPQGR